MFMVYETFDDLIVLFIFQLMKRPPTFFTMQYAECNPDDDDDDDVEMQ